MPSPTPAAAKSAASDKGAAGDKRLKMLDAQIRRQQNRADALLEVLHGAQELFGFLSDELLRHIGRSLRLPLSRVYGVATFYNYFALKPKGEHTCTVCMGTACYVKGSGEILAALEKHHGCKAGGTSADGKVSVTVARCVGACGIAPAIVFDAETVGKQSAEQVVARTQAWRQP